MGAHMLKKFSVKKTLVVPLVLLGGSLFVPACDDEAGTGDGPSNGGAPGACEGEELFLLADAAGGGAGGVTGQPEHRVTDKESGLVQCRDGRVNREKAVECGEPLTFDLAGLICDDMPISNYDPDFSYSYFPEVCGQLTELTCEHPPCLVQVGCQSDADCAEEEVCVCATEVQRASRCVPAFCKGAEDCESGECGAVGSDCQSDILGFACRTAQDECQSDEECGGITNRCTYDYRRDLWTCSGPSACE